MSNFISLPVYDKEVGYSVIAYVNIDQICIIIPKANQCKVVFSDNTHFVIDKDYEEIKEYLQLFGHSFDSEKEPKNK